MERAFNYVLNASIILKTDPRYCAPTDITCYKSSDKKVDAKTSTSVDSDIKSLRAV